MTDVYLYVIGRVDGPVKVGISSTPGARLSAIQTGCPFAIELIFAVKFPDRVHALKHEQIFHEVHDQKRLHGEWFRLEADLAIESIETAVEYANMDRL